MSQASLDGLGGSSNDHEKTEIDYFGYFTQAVKELLLHDEDYLQFKSELPGKKHGEEGTTQRDYMQNQSSSPYGNGVGAGLSDFKMKQLKVLVREGVRVLSSEVNEVLGSVEAMCKLRSSLDAKISWHDETTSDSQAGEVPCKKLKVISQSCSSGFNENSCGFNAQINKEVSTEKCVDCIHSGADLINHAQSQRKEVLGCRDGIEEIKGDKLQLDSRTSSKESEEEDDINFLLKSDSLQVKEAVKKYSVELFSTLLYMEQQLELLLDALSSTCRPMTRSEKQQLQKMIQRLPPVNLNRVVEIVGHGKEMGKEACHEIFLDLEKEDNRTLWRLYFYAEAVESAKRLACR